jgi:uncharacterized protein YkwD
MFLTLALISLSLSDVHTQVNQIRVQKHLPALELNAQLSEAATAKAEDMVSQKYWSHTTPSGKPPWSFIKATGYRYTVAGENLARNFSSSTALVNAWNHSPLHQKNLLTPQFCQVGYGQAQNVVVQFLSCPVKSANITNKSSRLLSFGFSSTFLNN